MSKRSSSFTDNRTAARFAAVQAVYSLTHNPNISAARLVREYIDHRMGDNIEGFQLGRFHKELFESLVVNALENKEELSDMLLAVLPEGWTLESMNPVLYAIALVAISEVAQAQQRPTAIIINDYIEITKDFFEGNEHKIINGFLDTIAAMLRGGDFSALRL